jgi:hypothetical protein
MDARQDRQSHRCIAGDSCRARRDELGTLQPALTEKPLTLCQGCHGHHREAIRRLPRDYTMLQITLGERSTGTSEPIRSTPSPVVLLNTTSDRLMSAIAEWSDRAACAVAAMINTPIPTTRRQPPKRTEKRNGKSIRSEPARGSVAEITWAATGPTPGAELGIALRFVEQHIDDLAAAPEWDYYVWAQPHRCTVHENLINVATEHVAAADETTLMEARAGLERARLAAALCDDCNGWSDHGQARELAYLNGFEILEQLTRLHHLTRKHLGHTILRHHSTLPCDACGAATLGRADGTWVIDCTTCGAKYTENELGFLIRMKIDEIHTKEENDMLRWLLAEAQWRLDQIQAKVDVLRDDDTIQLAGAGPIIIEAIDDVLGGSGRPTS